MASRKTGGEKESKREKSPSSPRLKKAVPPPDNPLLRYQADEVSLEGGDASPRQMAKLRAKAWEQTRSAAASDSSNTVDTAPPAEDP
jgi:hypothetical protein